MHAEINAGLRCPIGSALEDPGLLVYLEGVKPPSDDSRKTSPVPVKVGLTTASSDKDARRKVRGPGIPALMVTLPRI